MLIVTMQVGGSIHIPLEQGLRQRYQRRARQQQLRSIHIPLEQGLRHFRA